MEKRHFRNYSFTKTVEALNWAERVLAVQENEIHHLLADLNLPLYMTTNFDNFMVEALKHKGCKPKRAGLRWQQLENDPPQYVLPSAPSPEQPVVFHLNGYDGDPEQEKHLVLSEDDYLAHFVRMSRDQHSILPSKVIQMLAERSFLLLGYSIHDWEFRVVVQGLLANIDPARRSSKLHISVQLDVEQNPNVDTVIDYLQRYLGRFNLEIYWGTPQQFVSELHIRWQKYLEMGDEW
jgi:hypothetical protein